MASQQSTTVSRTDHEPSYRSISLGASSVVVDDELFPRPSTLARDYEVLSWVLSEAPRLELETHADALQFITDTYAAWYPQETNRAFTLREATQNLASIIDTSWQPAREVVLQNFFERLMTHYDEWATEEATDADLQTFHTAITLKDLMYQHGFVDRADRYNVHQAYTDVYERRFNPRDLTGDVTWKTELCTVEEYETAMMFLSDTDVMRIEDYVVELLEVLDRSVVADSA